MILDQKSKSVDAGGGSNQPTLPLIQSILCQVHDTRCQLLESKPVKGLFAGWVLLKNWARWKARLPLVETNWLGFAVLVSQRKSQSTWRRVLPNSYNRKSFHVNEILLLMIFRFTKFRRSNLVDYLILIILHRPEVFWLHSYFRTANKLFELMAFPAIQAIYSKFQ